MLRVHSNKQKSVVLGAKQKVRSLGLDKLRFDHVKNKPGLISLNNQFYTIPLITKRDGPIIHNMQFLA